MSTTPSLTTIFRPPVSCSAIITYNGANFWQGRLFDNGDNNCYPASYTVARNRFYSPGVCPSGWYSASSVNGTGALVTNTAENNALCCPLQFQAIEPTKGPTASGNTIFCGSVVYSPMSNVFSTANLNIGPIPEDYAKSTITINPATLTIRPTVWAEVIQVRWQETDNAIISLISQQRDQPTITPTISSSDTPSTTSQSSLSPSPTDSGSSSHSELSTGASIGVGVGAAVVAIVMIFGTYLILRKIRRPRFSQQQGVQSAPEERSGHMDTFTTKPFTRQELKSGYARSRDETLISHLAELSDANNHR